MWCASCIRQERRKYYCPHPVEVVQESMGMQFISTDARDQRKVTLKEALQFPIPATGHLWVPESIPNVSFPNADAPLSKFVAAALRPFVHLDEETLECCCRRALDGHVPVSLKRISPSIQELQLYHGPTESFKDVGCSVAATLYGEIFSPKEHQVLVATSGDTGSAAAHAFASLGEKAIPTVVIYPGGKISAYQEEQMTSLSLKCPAVRTLSVEGDFDHCQKEIKELIAESNGRLLTLNSISIARLLPQVGYYAWMCATAKETPVDVYVPTGNAGNVCAALIAKLMGAPIRHIVACCNANDMLSDIINGRADEFEARKTIETLATAMDIGAPSNWIRIWHFVNRDLAVLRSIFRASSISDEVIRATQAQFLEKHNENICPHTAVAYAVHDRLTDSAVPAVIVATASPVKFLATTSTKSSTVCSIVSDRLRAIVYPIETMVLIGMPGTGKTTLGRALNGAETDKLIVDQSPHARLSGVVADCDSPEAFFELEGKVVLDACVSSRGVISTGGSVVHSKLMEQIANLPQTLLVWLDADEDTVWRRSGDLNHRGVVMPTGVTTTTELYRLRRQLYADFADVCIRTDRLSVEDCVAVLQGFLYRAK